MLHFPTQYLKPCSNTASSPSTSYPSYYRFCSFISWQKDPVLKHNKTLQQSEQLGLDCTTAVYLVF